MDCDRLEKLIKSWYFQVQDEAMAPARMVSFMNQHISECPICLIDPLVRQEVDKITEIILPPPKAKKPAESKEKEEAPTDEDTVDEETTPSDEDPDENNENGDDDDESEIGVDLEEDY